jgi:peptidyl-dipeptidase A
MSVASSLVAELEARLAPLEREMLTAWWDASIAVSDDAERRRAATERAWSDALADPAACEALASARSPDRLVQRRQKVLAALHLPHAIPADLRGRVVDLQASIEGRFARHRAELDGATLADHELARILRTSDDSELRRRAWEASKTVGEEVAADVRALAHVRNDAAHAIGRRDFFALSLETTETDEDHLLATLAEVDRLTAAPFATWKRELDEQLAARFGIAAFEVGPHHYDDPFFQQAPAIGGVDLDEHVAPADLVALTERTFEGVGIDVAPVTARSDLEPRLGKNQHAFCLHVDRADDVRVLSNNVPEARWAETMLHEYGHAAYFLGLDTRQPWALRTMHMALTEGVAMLFGRLVHQPRWLHSVLGLDRSTVQELAPRLEGARRTSLLVFARWALVMTHFERGLYADPDGDHDTRWWDLVEHYQLVPRPPGRHAPDWAAKVHVAVAPVYYHNYLYGELFASQMQMVLRDRFGGVVDQPAAGTHLRDALFALGASAHWDALVVRATGAPLSAMAFAAEVAGPHGSDG